MGKLSIITSKVATLKISMSAISMASVIIIPKFFSPRELGIYNFMVSTITFLALLISFGIAFPLKRYLPVYIEKKEFGKAKYIIDFVLKYRAITIIVFTPVLVILFRYVYNVYDTLLLLFGVLGFIFFSSSQTLIELIYGLDKVVLYSLIQFLTKIIEVTFVILFAYLGSVRYAILMFILAQLVSISLSLFFGREVILYKEKEIALNLKKMWIENIGVFISGLLLNSMKSIALNILKILKVSDYTIGIFSSGLWLETLTIVFCSIFGFVFFPKMVKLDLNKKSDNALVSRYVDISISYTSILPSLFIVIAIPTLKVLISFVWGISYNESIFVLWILLLEIPAFGYFFISYNLMLSKNKIWLSNLAFGVNFFSLLLLFVFFHSEPKSITIAYVSSRWLASLILFILMMKNIKIKYYVKKYILSLIIFSVAIGIQFYLMQFQIYIQFIGSLCLLLFQFVLLSIFKIIIPRELYQRVLEIIKTRKEN